MVHCAESRGARRRARCILSARAMRRALERCVARASTSVVTSRSFSLAVSSSVVAAATVEGREDGARARERREARTSEARDERARAIAREGGARGWRQWISSSASDEGTSGDGGRTMEAAIDRSGLRRPPSAAPSERSGRRRRGRGGGDEGRMLGHLERAIKFAGGSIPVSDYVRECLTHPSSMVIKSGRRATLWEKGRLCDKSRDFSGVRRDAGGAGGFAVRGIGFPRADTLRVIEFGPGVERSWRIYYAARASLR